jgi:hypothetical protein
MDEKPLRNWRLTEEIWVVKPTTYSPSYTGFEPNEMEIIFSNRNGDKDLMMR